MARSPDSPDVSARTKIRDLLGEIRASGSFAARRTAPADDLHLEVEGMGELEFPVASEQARRLCGIARPAHYGKGEETLLDRDVRDTWEIQKERVRIDEERWDRTLLPVVEALGSDLGLLAGRLEAELHSMLVYGPGQFFLPHQDSERTDEMVGTLVVTLPSAFEGGALRVEHRGETVTFGGAERELSFVAFYSDCRHEVRPVEEGYRIVLTYDLMLRDPGTALDGAAAETDSETIEALADRLREHFTTPRPPRWTARGDTTEREPPARLVYLLDHEYTERGLAWSRLKGDDAARAVALRAAAERCGCALVLALAEIHETWSAWEPGWDEPRYGNHRRWERGGDGRWREEEPMAPTAGPEDYELVDLVDGSIALTHWIDRSGEPAAPIVTRVENHEVCFTTPTVELEPHASEYEGYMGNYGNTMDRWYRRAALVLWPQERAFTVRAEASPAWALETVKERIASGEIVEARELARSLLSFWDRVAPHEERDDVLGTALEVAAGLEDPESATALLRPFRVERLTPGAAEALAEAVREYGEAWLRSLLREWSPAGRRPGPRAHGPTPLAWITSSPRFFEALAGVDDPVTSSIARLLLEDRWECLREEIQRALQTGAPSRREGALAAIVRPTLGFLEAAAVAEEADLRDQIVAFLCSRENEALIPCLVQVLRHAEERVPSERRSSMGLESIRHHAVRRLEAWLERPARAEDDWSMTLPEGCDCELCETLGAFLSDPARRTFEWPINKQKRKHVHRRIDGAELPVRHETRRSGRPYTLVLTKEQALFEREARERQSWRSDLEWLTG